MDYEHIVEMISQSQIGAVLCCAGGDQYACGTGALAAGAPDRREPRDVDRVDHFRDVAGSAPETAPPLRQLTPTRIRREPERRRRSDSHKRRTKRVSSGRCAFALLCGTSGTERVGRVAHNK